MSRPVTVTSCRSCNARIVWMATKAGKRIPVDAKTVDERRIEWGPSRGDVLPLFQQKLGHIAHFATCPNADTHRRG